MTTEATERDLITEAEELLAAPDKSNRSGYALELLRRLVAEVKRLRLKVDAITGSRIRDLVKDEHDD